MAGEEGLGKASKARKHAAARTPYSRPKSAAGPSTDATPLLGNPSEAPGTAGKISYLGSVFSAATTPLRAAANNLINRVPMLSGYFNSAQPSPEDRQQSGIEGDGIQQQQQQPSPIENEAGPSGLPFQRKAAASPKQPPPAARLHDSVQEGLEFSFGAAPAAAAAPAASGPTPYDNVLSMLRKGPLAGPAAAELPKFPAPRTKEERAAALAADANGRRAASAPVVQPSAAFGAGDVTSPLPAFNFGSPAAGAGGGGGSGRRGEAFGQRRYAASRLGPYGAGAAPGSGLRGASHRPPLGGNTAAVNGGAGYVFSRFATGGGGGAYAGPSSAGPKLQAAGALPPAAAAGTGAANGSAGPAFRLGAGASPAPLAWTPMRATPGSAFRPSAGPASGSKRKADDTQQQHDTPLTEDHHGNVSILDAQRRLRQRSETGTVSADRRSWRAGRTPYQPRAGSVFGISGGLGSRGVGAGGVRPASVSPAPTLGGFAGITPLGGTVPQAAVPQHPSSGGTGGTGGASPGSKPTTDTARRILETLNDLDQTMKRTSTGAGDGAASAGTTPKVAPSPPPTDTLGSGLPGTSKAGKAGAEGAGVHKRRVTFAELTGTPSAAAKPTASTEEDEEDEDYTIEDTEEEDEEVEEEDSEQESEEEEEESEEEIVIVEEKKPVSKNKSKMDFKKRLQEKKKKAAATTSSPAAPALPAFNFGGAAAPPLFSFSTTPATSLSAAAAAFTAPTPGFGAPKPANEYTFGAKPKDADLKKKVKATMNAVAGGASSPTEPPTFLFGKQKKTAAAEKPTATTPVPAVKPDVLLEAKRIAEEAAKSPLPAVPGFSDEEEEKEKSVEPPEKSSEPGSGGAVTTGGWDMSFLQKNQQTASAATAAAAKEIDGGEKKTEAATPVFSFGVPTAATTTAPTTITTKTESTEPPKIPSFLAPTTAAAAAPATVPSFLAPAAPASTSAPTFNFGGAAPTPEPAAKPVEEKKEEAPVTSGWGDAFLKSNQSAAAAATEAAAKEAEGGAGGAAATTAPAFTFGATPAATTTTTTAAPAFTFGAAAAPATEAPTPAPFTFGAASKPAETTTAASEPVASTPAFTFGAAAAATPPVFGGPGATTAPAASSQPAFTFGASSTPATGAPFTFGAQQQASAGGAFTFGAGGGGGAASSAAASGFPSTTPEPAAAPSPAPFSFGAAPSSGGTSAPAATSFGFGAGSAAAPAPASTPSTGFGFGAGGAMPAAAPSTFAFGAQPAGQSPAPAAATPSGFGFGSAPMDNNNNTTGGFGFAAAAPAPGGAFGAPSAFGAPAAAAPGGFGATPPAPVFGGGGFGSAQPAFGGTPGGFGAPQAPAFGAPPQQPQGGFAFGAPQQQPAAFGAPQPPPGQMIPNPFGGGAPAAGGGFSIGTTGNSQSEGRRKVKVRRPRGAR